MIVDKIPDKMYFCHCHSVQFRSQGGEGRGGEGRGGEGSIPENSEQGCLFEGFLV